MHSRQITPKKWPNFQVVTSEEYRLTTTTARIAYFGLNMSFPPVLHRYITLMLLRRSKLLRTVVLFSYQYKVTNDWHIAEVVRIIRAYNNPNKRSLAMRLVQILSSDIADWRTRRKRWMRMVPPNRQQIILCEDLASRQITSCIYFAL